MSWTNVSWTADEGIQPLVDAINDALEGHANWELVETVVETHKTESGEDTYFDDTVHTFHVWRCKEASNGIGADFYVSFGRTIQVASGGGTGESGYMLFTTMKDWDEVTHRGLGHCGRGPSGFQLDSNGTYGNNGQYYPILEPRVEDGEGTWGYWGNFNQSSSIPNPIQLETPHLMSVSNGSGLGYPSFWDDDTEKPTTPQEAIVRVTKNSLLVLFKDDPSRPYYNYVAYCGAYDIGGLPDEMIPDVPILQIHGSSAFGNGSSLSTLCMTDLPGASQAEGKSASEFFSTPHFSNWGYNSYASGTDRQKMSYPSLTPLVALRWGLAGRDGYNTYSYNGLVWPIFGVWCLSIGDLPSGWEDGDTVMSPDGSECVILSISSDYMAFLIDKEAY